MSDLAEKILAAIQAEEDTVPPLQLDGRYVGPRTEAERKLLRRCAADREILQRYRETLAVYAAGEAPLALAGQLGAYEHVLHCLARGYGVQP